MSPHKGWKTQVHTRDVLRKIESQWKATVLEVKRNDRRLEDSDRARASHA